MTSKQAFREMLSRLEPTEIQKIAIRKSRETIDLVIQRDPRIHLFDPSHPSFLTGSYKRNTLIRPIHDVDLYVVVHYGLHKESDPPMKVMWLIRRALLKRYPQTKIQVDSPCIVINFSGLRGYKYEIVPVVCYNDNEDLFSMPAEKGTKWIHCYPKIPDKWLSESNHLNNGLFVPTIKILKQWVRENKVGLKSFHIELLAGSVFDSISTIQDYPHAVYECMRLFCQWIHYNKSPFVPEPGNPYMYVDQYLYNEPFRIRRVRKKLSNGWRLADRAFGLYLEGKENRAKRVWQKMFGAMFPAPPVYTPMPSLIPPSQNLQNQPTTFNRTPLSLSDLLANASNTYPKTPMQENSGIPLRDLYRNALREIMPEPKLNATNASLAEIMRSILLKKD